MVACEWLLSNQQDLDRKADRPAATYVLRNRVHIEKVNFCDIWGVRSEPVLAETVATSHNRPSSGALAGTVRTNG